MGMVQRVNFHNRKWRQMPAIPTNELKNMNNTVTSKDKKLICISPGGFKGFYLSGVIAYIKDNYDISDFYFSGASAGAWNAILFTYRGNLTEFMWNMIKTKPVVTKNETIRDYKYHLKHTIINNYSATDFDLDRVFIGVTIITPLPILSKVNIKENDLHKEEIHTSKIFIKTSIFSKFSTLEDALDCCIASSHIPFFMGRVFHIYNNEVAFDGGFSNYPYYPFVEPILNITPNMWNRSYTWPHGNLPKKRLAILEDYTTLLSKDRYDFWKLFQYGYEDTKQNRHFLDKVLIRKKP